jgi:hypothetical protein
VSGFAAPGTRNKIRIRNINRKERKVRKGNQTIPNFVLFVVTKFKASAGLRTRKLKNFNAWSMIGGDKGF